MAAKQYVAVIPLVIAKEAEGRDLYFYQGAVLSEDVTPESIANLLGQNFIAEVDAPVDAEEKVDPYKGKSSDELKAELATRNEGREDADKIVPADPGNKPEVLAALIADDEKSKQ